MKFIFYECSSLTSINLSSFKNEKVTNMSGMFGNCKSLISLDLHSFNTQKVNDMERTFET